MVHTKSMVEHNRDHDGTTNVRDKEVPAKDILKLKSAQDQRENLKI